MGLLLPFFAGLLAMLFVLYLVIWTLQKSQGTDKMKSISAAIQEGANIVRIGTKIFGPRE